MRNLIQEIKEEISTGDIYEVRGTLQNFIVWDSEQMPKILETIELAKELNNVFVEHDDEEFNVNKQTWDRDYLNEVKAELTLNFSEERYRHLCEVSAYLSAKSQKEQKVKADLTRQSISESKPKRQQRPIDQKSTPRGNDSKKMLWIGLTITIVLILVISLVKLVQR